MKQTTVIAGLDVHTYTTDAFGHSTKPILALFVLHGNYLAVRERTIRLMYKISSPLWSNAASEHPGEKDLMIVAFDHRNHGARLRDQAANLDFQSNPNHVLDMYSIQTGTANDVSFVMDFLEAYLFPSGERSIAEWGVAGVSLGGHSAWIAAAADPRVKIAIPIIGCPNFLALMGPRAEANGISVGPPHFPESLLRVIRASSLPGLPYSSKGADNPFLGKKLLVLSGGSDPLVPWAASEKFVQGLEVGEGSKEYVVYDGVGHEVAKEMVEDVVKYILRLLSN